jgi:hypothetical protein
LPCFTQLFEVSTRVLYTFIFISAIWKVFRRKWCQQGREFLSPVKNLQVERVVDRISEWKACRRTSGGEKECRK